MQGHDVKVLGCMCDKKEKNNSMFYARSLQLLRYEIINLRAQANLRATTQ